MLSILFFGLIFDLILGIFISFILFLIIFLHYKQIAEILADKYSIKRTKKGVFITALTKTSRYNNHLHLSKFEKIKESIFLHLFYPYPKLRYRIIKCMDNHYGQRKIAHYIKKEEIKTIKESMK